MQVDEVYVVSDQKIGFLLMNCSYWLYIFHHSDKNMLADLVYIPNPMTLELIAWYDGQQMEFKWAMRDCWLYLSFDILRVSLLDGYAQRHRSYVIVCMHFCGHVCLQ